MVMTVGARLISAFHLKQKLLDGAALEGDNYNCWVDLCCAGIHCHFGNDLLASIGQSIP